MVSLVSGAVGGLILIRLDDLIELFTPIRPTQSIMTAAYDIHQGLRRHRAGATSVLVSHRLGAIRDADQIVVLSGGQVTERGTHETPFLADGE
ncbi:hypothetical protein GCM10027569_92170 [Flindersiella endophytica]